MNKTRGTSMVPSRLADELEYRISDNTYSGNTNPLGTLDITQKSLNVTYPTIQGAIDDLTGTFLDVNTVITNTDGESPSGIAQVDSVKFTGFISTEDEITEIFGLPFKFELGDTSEEVAQKFVVQVNEYVTKNEFFTFAQVSSADPTVVDIRYIDFRYHPPYSKTVNGITVETTLSSPHKAGYGTWAKLGTSTVVLDSPADPLTLYYFKRIA
ncbi:hypothetical protein [Providencia phage PSTRCR_127]|nr:hypothetical protein [Providencia phage PSTRCR_127]